MRAKVPQNSMGHVPNGDTQTEDLIVLSSGASTEAVREGFPLTLEGLTRWLKSKNVIPSDSRLLSYTDLDAWHRAGGETYQATFAIGWIENGLVSSNRVRLKALVTLNGELALEIWTRRRRLLHAKGVPVSRWFSWGDALIIEQYYPGDYTSTRQRQQLGEIAEKLDELGFAPRNYLLDIRCDEEGSPVYVDFGEDLGEPGEAAPGVSTARFAVEFQGKAEKGR